MVSLAGFEPARPKAKTGFKPAASACSAIRRWSARRESNPQNAVFETATCANFVTSRGSRPGTRTPKERAPEARAFANFASRPFGGKQRSRTSCPEGNWFTASRTATGALLVLPMWYPGRDSNPQRLAPQASVSANFTTRTSSPISPSVCWFHLPHRRAAHREQPQHPRPQVPCQHRSGGRSQR
jgi:hypothetical protein